MLEVKKSKRDGTVITSKAEICQGYDESSIPWPIKPVVKLDYCWRLTYTMWKHSFILAVPVTGIHFIYTNMPQVWKMTRKTLPKFHIAFNYLTCVLLINAVNIAFSLTFEDYCKRNSLVYNTEIRNSRALRNMIKETNEQNKQTFTHK